MTTQKQSPSPDIMLTRTRAFFAAVSRPFRQARKFLLPFLCIAVPVFLLPFVLVAPASAHLKSVTLPFTRSANGWILIPAKVGGNAGVFVLDTGARDSFVSAKLIGKTVPDIESWNINIGGKGTFGQIVTVLSLGQDDFTQPMMMGSTDNLNALAKTRVDGIIGLSVLGQYRRIIIDFRAQTVTLEAA